ncbi:uncharacterized protein LOC120434039, partial [Oreochromis aureus]
MRKKLSIMINLLCLGSLLTTLIWYTFEDSFVELHRPIPQRSAPKPSELCKGCKEVIDKVKKLYNQTWKKHEENYHRFSLQLSINCNGSNNGIVTQENTPVGSKIVCDKDRSVISVTPELFKIFIKENPFSKKRWDTCSIVGSGGILTNSGCGKMIDSADFVIRCNLPPVENEFHNDVGMKTNLVTANPSLFMNKYGSLMGRRRAFADSLHQYGNSLLLFPCFSYGGTRPVCQRAVYAIEDMDIPIQSIFLNPRMALTKLLNNRPDTPYFRPPPLHFRILNSCDQQKVISWDFKDETAKALTTKRNKVIAITDGESVTKVTIFEEFASKVQQGGSFIMRGYDLRGTVPPFSINVTSKTQFFRAPTLNVKEDLYKQADQLLHPPAPLTALQMSSASGGLITAQGEVVEFSAVKQVKSGNNMFP